MKKKRPPPADVAEAAAALADEPLSVLEAKFVMEYLKDGNGQEAALRAGYQQTKGSAAVTATHLLKKPNLAAALRTQLEAQAARALISADMVMRELALLGFANMQDFLSGDGAERVLDLSKLTRAQAAAIQEYIVEEYVEGRGDDARVVKRTKFKLAPKAAPLEMLAKHFGLTPEKVKVELPAAADPLNNVDISDPSFDVPALAALYRETTAASRGAARQQPSKPSTTTH